MPEQLAFPDHRGARAIRRMVEFAPSTGGLALWVLHRDHPPGMDAPAVTTDGATLFYGSGFEALPVAEQAGLVAHEVLHIALRHPQRYLELRALLGDVDLKLFNICADAIVNSALSHLGWLALPRTAIHLDRLLSTVLDIAQPIEISLLEWDVERLYRAIDDRQQGGRSGKSGERRDRGGAGGESDQGERGQAGRASQEPERESATRERRADGPKSARVRALGASTPVDLMPAPNPDAPPEAEAAQTLLWSERIARSHAGDGLHSMLRTLLADLPRVQTPWEQILRTQLARGLSTKPGLSWSRPTRSYIANQGRSGPNRRLPWEPGSSSAKPSPRLVVIVDVSGSIQDTLLERFAVEIEAITRRLESELVLVIGDDCVRRVARFEPGRSDLREIAFNGRGGTDFTPLLVEADKHRPDIAVVLTDLDGPANFRPRWPVIWAVPQAHRSAAQPFGRILPLS
jgi:predicted metal-dependent peptidase